MPSKSKAQHNLMELIAHGGKCKKKHCPPKSVAKEFVQADKGMSFEESIKHRHKTRHL